MPLEKVLKNIAQKLELIDFLANLWYNWGRGYFVCVKRGGETMADKVKNIDRLWDYMKLYTKACGRLAQSQKYRKNIDDNHIDEYGNPDPFKPQHKYGTYGSDADLKKRKEDVNEALKNINAQLEVVGLDSISNTKADAMMAVLVNIDYKTRNWFYREIDKHKKKRDIVSPTVIFSDYLRR